MILHSSLRRSCGYLLNTRPRCRRRRMLWRKRKQRRRRRVSTHLDARRADISSTTQRYPAYELAPEDYFACSDARVYAVQPRNGIVLVRTESSAGRTEMTFASCPDREVNRAPSSLQPEGRTLRTAILPPRAYQYMRRTGGGGRTIWSPLLASSGTVNRMHTTT